MTAPASRSRSRRASASSVARAIQEMALLARQAVFPGGRLTTSLPVKASAIVLAVAFGSLRVAVASCAPLYVVRWACWIFPRRRSRPFGPSVARTTSRSAEALGSGVEAVGLGAELDVVVKAGSEVDLAERVFRDGAV